MPSQLSRTRRCQQLEEQREQLRRSVAEQQQQNRDLLLRHNLLQAWCECLSLLQVNRMTQHCSQRDSSADTAQEELERLLEVELALLNQLTSNPACTSQEAAFVLDVGVDTIAPAGDPMWYFRHHINQPPMANAASITFEQLAQLWRESALQLSVQLHIMQDCGLEQHAAAKAQVLAAFDRIVNSAMSLVTVGREDLVESANILNLNTLQPDVDGATKQAALTSSLIDRISMTAQQQHVVATGAAMYMQLLNPVMQERQRLQSQFAASASGEASQQDANSTNSAGSNGVASNGALLGDMFKARQQRLEAQQKQAARLQLLIRKEMMLRMAGMTWFVGCLSAQQVAKACVLCWPYILRPSLLATEIQKRAEAEQSGSSQQQPRLQQRSARVSPSADNASSDFE